MAYDLIISERANELIDRLAAYLLNNLKIPALLHIFWMSSTQSMTV